jgi:hypothetical protein
MKKELEFSFTLYFGRRKSRVYSQFSRRETIKKYFNWEQFTANALKMSILRKRQYLKESQVETLGSKYKSIPDKAPHSSVNLKSQIYKCLESDYETSNIVSLLVVVTIFLSLPYF